LKIKANLIIPDSKKLMKLTGFNEGGIVQKYIDEFIFDKSEPYLPGYHLYRDSVSANKPGNGNVIFNTADANYLYDGNLMVDPITKIGAFPIRNGKISFNEKDGQLEGFVSRKNAAKIIDPRGRKLDYHGNGMRGPKWFDRMIEEKMNELLKGIQNINNGGRNE